MSQRRFFASDIVDPTHEEFHLIKWMIGKAGCYTWAILRKRFVQTFLSGPWSSLSFWIFQIFEEEGMLLANGAVGGGEEKRK